MNQILIIVPIALALCLFAASVKVAALILRRTRVSWKHSFIYTLMIFGIMIVARVLSLFVHISLPIAVPLALAFISQVAIGGWFFARRATSSSGDPVGWRGGAQLSAINFGVVVIFGLIFYAVTRALLTGAQP
jgi:hypothetical protein